MDDKDKQKWGGRSFIVGLVIAIAVAIFASASPPAWSVFLLALLGVIVGLLNVADREAGRFLVASIAFLISFQALAAVGTAVAFGWSAIGAFFSLMSVFIAPAAAIVAVKEIYELARD